MQLDQIDQTAILGVSITSTALSIYVCVITDKKKYKN